MWLERLQIAIIERDENALKDLLGSPFESNDADEAQRAQFLLLEAVKVIQELKNETKMTMIQLKKNIDFLNSTQLQTHNKLDIRS
ncbi:hypothetical protein [Sulfurimonas sp.]|uniref:hypothetical protein n=1 Tax=Sulfurimonas sp. TaxID=2022749 RepID=UPI0025D8BCE2|nr:hypothetical protein [Sulfurimonas sp.]MDD5157992.1 hypothetical protein [Sulfurimonas sp.]